MITTLPIESVPGKLLNEIIDINAKVDCERYVLAQGNARENSQSESNQTEQTKDELKSEQAEPDSFPAVEVSKVTDRDGLFSVEGQIV